MPVDRLSGRAWGTLLVLCGALFLDALDVSMIGVALPSIRRDLGLSTSALQWVVSGYVLGYGGFLLLGGRAADLFGRRRMFIWSLAVFIAASALGGLSNDGALLIATRFVKGISAAFTAPAGLSIITTSFAEGPARNKALSIYTATGATGFAFGLVFGGLLTELGWRWVFFLPVPFALLTLAGAARFLSADERRPATARRFDVLGAVGLTAAALLLVFTLVEAPDVGWNSFRTIASALAVAVILAGFALYEQRVEAPLVRLGILRSFSLARANIGAISLFGGWIGFLFIVTLYLQQLRGWSALNTGLAILPAAIVVAVLAPRMGPVVTRFGVTPVIVAGLAAHLAAYLLFLRVGLHSRYTPAMLPTFLLVGLGFALAYGTLNIAATNGIAPEEQGLAGGIVNTAFQIGGALILAIVTAVSNASRGNHASSAATMHGFHTAIIVSAAVAGIGILANLTLHRHQSEAAPASAYASEGVSR
jgi:EmrB/QacA subfamily drug resistance transporter